MRTNHGMSRAQRKQRAMAREAEKHHYTDRTSVPVRSNSNHVVPGTRAANTVPSTLPIRFYPGYQRAARTGWDKPMNTNTQLCRDGISSYYQPREGWGQSRA